jgi:glutaminyl-tRNA synthetase
MNDNTQLTKEPSNNPESTQQEIQHFIQDIINEDLRSGKHASIATRFPPEPNGYLHIGHCKSICLNFGLADQYGGTCNLRYDDTNPSKEEQEFVDAIQEDIKWLGFNWSNIHYASDYFDQLYAWAELLIQKGSAYICHLTPDEMREHRGTLTSAGKNSPYRERSVEENLALFRAMRDGACKPGECTLRAKIDMASPIINLRDPVMYRVLDAHHHRTGDKWKIYPSYDYSHGLSDAIEKITHSLCTVEFEKHRPLYEWFLEAVGIPAPRPRQIEFAPLVIAYEMTSKRNLRRLVEQKIVDGWDDPRMPTLRGMRRRGYSPAALREFIKRVGVAKAESMVDGAFFDFCQREVLNATAERTMAVLDPLKLVITNYPEGQEEWLDLELKPEGESSPKRKIPFSRELLIEREDFMEQAANKWFRMAPGKEVRLKHGYYVTCQEVIKDADGQVVELHCTYDPQTRGGWSDDGRKVKGTIHWVSAAHAVKAEVRLFEKLWTAEKPLDLPDGQDVMVNFNQASKKEVVAYVDPGARDFAAEKVVQFVRLGYFVVDRDTSANGLVFNRIVDLKDSWRG